MLEEIRNVVRLLHGLVLYEGLALVVVVDRGELLPLSLLDDQQRTVFPGWLFPVDVGWELHRFVELLEFLGSAALCIVKCRLHMCCNVFILHDNLYVKGLSTTTTALCGWIDNLEETTPKF